MTDTTSDHQRGRGEEIADKLLVASIAMSLLVVVAPLALSANDLGNWAEDRLGLTGVWRYVPAAALDIAAATLVLLIFHATLRAESAGAARLFVAVLAGGSSWANYRQGLTLTPDAAVFYAAMPVIGAVLLDLVLRRLRRTVLADIGAVERPLPRFRAVRWLVLPGETLDAWRTAIRFGLTDPDQALAMHRYLAAGGAIPTPEALPADVVNQLALAAPSPADVAGELPAGPEDDDPAVDSDEATAGDSDQAVTDSPAPAVPDDDTPADLRNWRKNDAIRLAFDRLGRIDGGDAVNWLAKRDFKVNSNYAYQVARQVREEQAAEAEAAAQRPVLAAVPTETAR